MILFSLAASNAGFAQQSTFTDKLQYGASIKATLAINNIKIGSDAKKNEPPLSFRLSGSLGIGKSWLNKSFYPTINTEFLFYNSGFGSSSIEKGNRPFIFDIILAFTLTAGIEDGSNDYLSLTPLRYFSDFAYPALKNPYNYSASLGTNVIFSTDLDKDTQRIGFLNLNGNGFQFSYYNDGTPFGKYFLGDGEDRYYTGGGTISFDKKINEKMLSVELSYHRYTGFNKNAFELSSIIGNSLVDYGKDKEQIWFNKNIWRLNASLNDNNMIIGITGAINNTTKYDGQGYIHLILSDDSYHFIPYNRHFSIEPFVIIQNQNLK